MIAPLIATMLNMFPVDGASSNDVTQVVQDMTLPGMSVGVLYTSCGQQNAAYFPALDMLIVCTEDFTMQPGALRFIVAHEMGHATIHQLNIPFTGSEEVAADELAAVYSGISGRPGDTMEMALYFEELSVTDNGDVEDDHPMNDKRAWTLACLSDGAEEQPALPACKAAFERAADHWKRLIVNGLIMLTEEQP